MLSLQRHASSHQFLLCSQCHQWICLLISTAFFYLSLIISLSLYLSSSLLPSQYLQGSPEDGLTPGLFFQLQSSPLQWRSSQLEHHLASPSQKHRIADATVPSDRWDCSLQPTQVVLSWLQANALEEKPESSCGRTEKTSWKEKKLSKSILASIYYALSSGLYKFLYGGADGKRRELCRLYCILHFSIITITDKL